MQTVGQIIRRRREALDMTLAALAQRIGATKSYLSMIENHRVANPPSAEIIRKLEKALRIADGELARAADWQNTPPPVRSQLQDLIDKAQQGEELAKWLKQTTGQRRGGGKNLDPLFKSGELTRRVNAMLTDQPPAAKAGPRGRRSRKSIGGPAPLPQQVPLINKVAAGYPSDFTDLDYPVRVADSYVACPDMTDPQAFAATVVGDSMLPDYREGDIVIFSPAAKVSDGCDCFVRLEPDHETTFKRIFFDNGDIRLQPLNPKFKSQVFKREQVAGLYKAVARYQKL